jgi:hypothetical protein
MTDLPIPPTLPSSPSGFQSPLGGTAAIYHEYRNGAPVIDCKLLGIIAFYRIANKPGTTVHSGDFLYAANGVSLS